MRALAVESLSIRGFRNLASVDIELGPRFNVLSGDNGQGKTNLLEALYVAATSKSFRTSRLTDLVEARGKTASVRARMREAHEEREQCVGLRAGVRAARIDGKRPETLAAYAVRSPVVAFHAGLLSLSAGSGEGRRKLLDRLALYLWPTSIADVDAYARAARARQRALETRGERGSDVESWEELMVRHGLALSRVREIVAIRLGAAAEQAFRRIGAAGSALATRYDRRSPDDAQAFRDALVRSRSRDLARGSPTVGPNRDDIALELDGNAVRGIASQGQHRTVVLALALAEIEVIAGARGVQPILLLDDVSSELDGDRTRSLLATLGRGEGQVILTTTRPELIDSRDSFGERERRDFVVVSGNVRPVAGAPEPVSPGR